MNKDRSMLTDAQWKRLSPLWPGQAQSPGTTAKDTRRFVEAVLRRARCGVSRRDLPAERFGPWHMVYARFRRWHQAGGWPQVLAQVQNATGLHLLMVDSTAVRAHQVAAGAKEIQARRPSARPQPGRLHDQAPPELRCLRPDLRPGPDWRPSRRLPASARAAAPPPAGGAGRVGRPRLRRGLCARPDWASRSPGRDAKQKNRTVPFKHDAEMYKERNQIECAINGLKCFRAVATRFDKRTANYFATCCLIAVLTWL